MDIVVVVVVWQANPSPHPTHLKRLNEGWNGEPYWFRTSSTNQGEGSCEGNQWLAKNFLKLSLAYTMQTWEAGDSTYTWLNLVECPILRKKKK